MAKQQRKVFFELHLQEFFKTQNKPTNSTLLSGLLIGQVSESQTFIVCAFPTPPQPLSPESSERLIDEAWIIEHSRQISRMLCGGLQVRGIFCFAFGSELLNKLSTSFQHILKNICYQLQQQQPHQSQEKLQNQQSEEKKKFFTEEMILLTSVFGSEKFNCSLLCFQETKTKYISLELKFRSFLSEFLCFDALWRLDVTVPIYSDTEPLKNQIQRILTSEWKRIEDTEVVVDGKIMNQTETSPQNETKPKKQKIQLPQQKVYFVELLRPPFYNLLFNDDTNDKWSRTSEMKTVRTNSSRCVLGLVTIKGEIRARGFTHYTLSWPKIVQILKEDIYSSLWNRFELLCDELERLELDQDVSKSTQQQQQKMLLEIPTKLSSECQWILPRRVFVNFKAPITVCDYLMPYETEEDCLERLRALLSFETTKDSLNFVEKFPNINLFENNLQPSLNTFRKETNGTNSKASSSSTTVKHSSTITKQTDTSITHKRPTPFQLLILSFIVLPLLALVLSYLMATK